MTDFRHAKTMAKLLRQGLGKRQIIITHADSLEIVAQQFGYANWNILAARIDEADDEADLKIPKNWGIHGISAHLYRCGIDPDHTDGTALIYRHADKSNPETKDFCTLMQSIAAEKFRRKRVCLTAELKTEAVKGMGTIWLRVDGEIRNVIKFDNMQNREIEGVLSGTQDWTARQIVLDVPKNAQSIHYGFLLQGSGHAWCRKIRLDETTADTPETNTHKELLPYPANMDFMEISM